MDRGRKQGRPRRMSALNSKGGSGDCRMSQKSLRSERRSHEIRSTRTARQAMSRVRSDYSAPPPQTGSRSHFTHSGEETGSIKVAVRFRPLSKKERSKGDTAVWGVDECNNVGLYVRGSFNVKYKYDTVFDEAISNMEVHRTIAGPIVETAMSGVNGTVFAYGVTSSGKTHTMMGESECPGIVPQSISQIFDIIENHPNREYLLRLSMMEIYNEVLNDLFEPSRTNLKIREHKSKGLYVEGLKEVEIVSAEHALSMIAAGDANRKVSATQYNEGSSRSHTLCRLSIEVHSKDPSEGGRTLSYLNLIDLAGSESARAALSKGHRLEGSYINKSLLTLGTVIHKLSEGKSKGHIPYRDSKLTRLLQNSLSGRGSKMAIICTVTPSSSQAEETHNTLKFASRAKKIEIKVSKNEIMDQKSLMLRYQMEINELKRQLEAMTSKASQQQQQQHAMASDPDPAIKEELSKVKERLEEELHARLKREEDKHKLEARIERLTRLILHSTRPHISPKTNPQMSRSHSYEPPSSRSMLEAAEDGALNESKGRKVYTGPVKMATTTQSQEIMMHDSSLKNPGAKNNKSSHSDYLENVDVMKRGEKVDRQMEVAQMLRIPEQESANVLNVTMSKISSENKWLREQLDLMRQVCADREMDIVRRESECQELRRKVNNFELNPCSARSQATDDETQSLEYTLLKADRGILEEALSTMKKENVRLKSELVRAKIDLKAAKKKIEDPENMIHGAAAELSPTSPLSRSISGTESAMQNEGVSIVNSKLSSIESDQQLDSVDYAASNTAVDTPKSGSGSVNMENDPKLKGHIQAVERKVRAAMSKVIYKDKEIERLTSQMRKMREDSERVMCQLQELSKENESLKTRLQSTEVLNHRMQGYLLDGLPTMDLETLFEGLSDASDRIQRTILNRRLASFSAHHEPMDSAEPKELGLEYYD